MKKFLVFFRNGDQNLKINSINLKKNTGNKHNQSFLSTFHNKNVEPKQLCVLCLSSQI